MFSRPVTALAAASPYALDIDFTGKFLHENPGYLGRVLQKKISEASAGFYEAVILGYGLCGGAAAGLAAGKVPLVIPRVHDCVSMFLGSHERYMEEFSREPGTFWFIPGYFEKQHTEHENQAVYGHPLDSVSGIGAGNAAGKYGEDDLEYLEQTMGAWKKRYRRAVLLEGPEGSNEGLAEKVRRESIRNNWEFIRMDASWRLFEKLLNGPWDEDFLVLQPGEKVPLVLPPGSCAGA